MQIIHLLITFYTNDNFDPNRNFFNEKTNSVESTHIDKLKDFLNDIKEKFSVIVLSETWIDNDKTDLNSLFYIPNYSFIHDKRKTNDKGGGLGIYVQKTLDYKIFPNLT